MFTTKYMRIPVLQQLNHNLKVPEKEMLMAHMAERM